jgi:hypothetical protein
MTDLGWSIDLTQRAAENQPAAINSFPASIGTAFAFLFHFTRFDLARQ